MMVSRTTWLRTAALCVAMSSMASTANAQQEPPPLVIGDPSAQSRSAHLLPPPSATSQGSARSTSKQGGWWMSLAGAAVVLAIFGGLSMASRRFLPGQPAAPLRVIGRASLSPKHAVYLVKAGDRVLILGAGAQGPPALLGEWAEPGTSAPTAAGSGAAS